MRTVMLGGVLVHAGVGVAVVVLRRARASGWVLL